MPSRRSGRLHFPLIAALVLTCLLVACEGRDASNIEGQPAVTPETARRRVEGAVQLAGSESHGGVHVFLGGTSHSLWTDSRGRFAFDDVKSGQYELIAEKAGYTDVVRNIELPLDASSAAIQIPLIVLNRMADSQPTTKTLAVAQPPILTIVTPRPTVIEPVGNGRIAGGVILQDAEGNLSNDFPAVQVYIDELELVSPLGPDGSFVFQNLPARRLLVTARGDRYVLDAPVAVDLTRAQEGTAVLRLKQLPAATNADSGGSIIGMVLPPENGPEVRTIRVSLAGTSISGITDAAGNFELGDIPEGEYALVIEAEGYDSLQLPDVIIAQGETTDVGQLALRMDISEPEVVATSPEDGARRVAVKERVPILIRFSEPMNRDSVKDALFIEPDVAYRAYMGNEHPRTNDSTLIVELLGESATRALDFGTRYRIAISDLAESAKEVPLAAPFEMSFTTGGPALVDWYPRDEAEDVGLDLNRSIRFRLNDRLKPEIKIEKYLHIRPRMDQSPNVHATYDTRTGWSEIRVFGIWKPETNYRVTLDRGLVNANGVRFENLPQSIRFRTAALVPLVPLSIDDIKEFPGRGRHSVR